MMTGQPSSSASAYPSAVTGAQPVAVLPIADPKLENHRVKLRFVAEKYREPLRAIALDDGIWRHFTRRVSGAESGAESFDQFFDDMLSDHAAGKRLVFIILDKCADKSTGQNADSVAGSMSFGNINLPERRLEIGWSWLGTAFQGKGVNGAAKFAMMQYGFEQLGLLRIEFKTDARNTAARKALTKIGATEEGTFRCYNTMPDGTRRNAVYYSVIHSDWAKVKTSWTGE